MILTIFSHSPRNVTYATILSLLLHLDSTAFSAMMEITTSARTATSKQSLAGKLAKRMGIMAGEDV